MRPTTGDAEMKKLQPAGGLAVWLLERLRKSPRPQPRLALLERVTLAPRQTLALVEAEGRRFLVATSQDGGPVFYALDGQEPPAGKIRRIPRAGAAGRIAW
ncbi:MAG: flagellar biosynthetic protein FliO [Acidobacteriota bacterium]|nr:flagellar biosynthetic protein FliO [Acidobacteriota bacterium]